MSTKNFISCDWGTSNFRLRMVNREHGQVMASMTTPDGVSSIYEATKQSGQDQYAYFLEFLRSRLLQWQHEQDPAQTPVLISGMASSSIGIKELPYRRLPIHADGSDLLVEKLESGQMLKHPLFLVSGACTGEDIMRGEETLLAGCETIPDSFELFMFPGTHSKHVYVRNQVAESIQSFMTGEVFDLLAHKSILRHSFIWDPLEKGEWKTAFTRGLEDAKKNNWLHHAFSIRAKHLLQTAHTKDHADYLSGLLIGTELLGMRTTGLDRISVIAGETLMEKYLVAVEILFGQTKREGKDSSEAMLAGHMKILAAIEDGRLKV